jgi:hypothetical protein
MWFIFVCRYAAGATIQVVLFGTMAIALKSSPPLPTLSVRLLSMPAGDVPPTRHFCFCFLMFLVYIKVYSSDMIYEWTALLSPTLKRSAR